MKKILAIALLIATLQSCTKDKCYIILDASHKEICSKCFHTVDERTVFIEANKAKTPEEQCKQ